LPFLSLGQIAALQNLIGKKAGKDMGWINIADARALTLLGLAERGREGWTITAAGLSRGITVQADTPQISASQVVQF
jgi:hypothetical protein